MCGNPVHSEPGLLGSLNCIRQSHIAKCMEEDLLPPKKSLKNNGCLGVFQTVLLSARDLQNWEVFSHVGKADKHMGSNTQHNSPRDSNQIKPRAYELCWTGTRLHQLALTSSQITNTKLGTPASESNKKQCSEWCLLRWFRLVPSSGCGSGLQQTKGLIMVLCCGVGKRSQTNQRSWPDSVGFEKDVPVCGRRDLLHVERDGHRRICQQHHLLRRDEMR